MFCMKVIGHYRRGYAARTVAPLFWILDALRAGFAARDVRLGFALPACRKAGKKENSWGYARGSGSALYTRIKQR